MNSYSKVFCRAMMHTLASFPSVSLPRELFAVVNILNNKTDRSIGIAVIEAAAAHLMEIS